MAPANPFRPKTLAEEVASYVRKELLLSDTYPPAPYPGGGTRHEARHQPALSGKGSRCWRGGTPPLHPPEGLPRGGLFPGEIEELYDIRYALEEILFREIIRRAHSPESSREP